MLHLFLYSADEQGAELYCRKGSAWDEAETLGRVGEYHVKGDIPFF